MPLSLLHGVISFALERMNSSEPMVGRRPHPGRCLKVYPPHLPVPPGGLGCFALRSRQVEPLNLSLWFFLLSVSVVVAMGELSGRPTNNTRDQIMTRKTTNRHVVCLNPATINNHEPKLLCVHSFLFLFSYSFCNTTVYTAIFPSPLPHTLRPLPEPLPSSDLFFSPPPLFRLDREI